MITLTLGDAVTQLEYLADLRGQTTGANPRHTTADLYRTLNDSYRMVRSFVTSKGFREFIVPGNVTSLPSAPETSETYGVVPFPTDAVSLQGVDVLFGGRWHPLERVDWEERRTLQAPSNGGFPSWFAVRNMGTVSAAVASVGSIAIFPFSTGGSYRLFYLPEWTNLTDPLHLFSFAEQSWKDMFLYDAAIKVIGLRDGDIKKKTAEFERALARAAQLVGQHIPHRISTGPRTFRRSENFRSSRF